MNRNKLFREDGQSIILVAVAIAALFGFVALSVDIGSFYGQRRAMQNAADAGALAGARELCFGNPDNWETAALDYAETRNGAPEATAVLEGENVVHVTTSIDAPVFFAPVIGVAGPVTVSAEARAVCGVAMSACGLWPVAFKDSSWESIRTQCGRDFALWGSRAGGGGSDIDDTVPPIDCDIYDCDIFPGSGPPGESDILLTESRAWLDFSYSLEYDDEVNCDQPGCGANELKCWIANDSDAKVTIGSCIARTSGVKAGVKQEIDDRAGDIVRFPIFDTACNPSNSNCSEGIHMVGLGCGEVVGWMQSVKIEKKDGTNPHETVHLVHLRVGCGQACNSQCGTTVGGGLPGAGQVGAVSLQ